METFEKTIQVGPDDLDDLDHVNNVRYVQWIQDISKEHWQTRASEEMRRNVVWVVMTHHIAYKNAAKLGDTVRVSTHIADSKGAVSVRVVEMHHATTDQLLVRAKTEWCLLNAENFKPMRISDDIKNVFHKGS